MKQFLVHLLLTCGLFLQPLHAAESSGEHALPIRGFCIQAPSGNRLEEFIKFIEEELAPRSVNTLICDWHYGRPDQTAVYFALKGLDVVSCPWKNPDVAAAQVTDMLRFRQSSTPQMKKHFLGVMQTVWSGAGNFLDEYYGRKPPREQKNPEHTEAKCFIRLFEEVKK